MHEGSRPWKAAALLLIGLETGALFWAYYAFDLGGWVRRLGSDGTMLGILGQIPAAAHAVFPGGIVSAVGGFIAASGVPGSLQSLAVRAAALGTGLGASSLGSAVVAPAYFAARRLLRHAPSRSRARQAGSVRAANRTSRGRRQPGSKDSPRAPRRDSHAGAQAH